MPDLQDVLNERLKEPRYDTYEVVKFLGLFWEDGHESYREELRQFQDYLGEIFGYRDAEEFPIPSQDSHLELAARIDKTILDLNKQTRTRRSALLIIHYGGHGDEDADESRSQKQRSVWAAHAEGGPTLQWYEIQPSLKRAKFDILLILDCCYAAQAGRGRKNGEKDRNIFTILAAAGMDDRTPKPGPQSFTNAIIRECAILLERGPCVLVSELHQRLVDRKANLITTPIIINASPTTIKLQHIDNALTTKAPADSAMLLQLTYTSQAFDDLADSTAQWLGHNVPSWVSSITVADIVRITKQSSRLVKDVANLEDISPTTIGQEKKENVVQAWDRIIDLMSAHQVSELGSTVELLRERASSLLKRLDSANEKLLEAVVDNVSDSGSLQQLFTHSQSESLDLIRPILLRRTIQCPKNIGIGITVEEDRFLRRSKLEEYKPYRPGLDPTDIDAAKTRLELLAGVLSSEKPSDYRSLPFTSWNHEPSEYRFVLTFDIPLEFNTNSWVSLHEAIKTTTKTNRPTLEERLRMGVSISNAVYKWHTTGWVHQGIESNDIVLFYKMQQRRLDYTSPFLGGFEFARPSQAPSLGRYVEDLTRDVYRHPERQGPSRDGHKKRHDLYSLGVVLLELGLWQDATVIANPRRLKDIGVKMMAENLITATEERLGFYVGDIYAQAVRTCLKNDFAVMLDDQAESNLDQAFKFLVVDKLREGISIP